MPKFTVDGIEYNSEDLTDNGKAQLASLQFLETQMNKLKSEILNNLVHKGTKSKNLSVFTVNNSNVKSTSALHIPRIIAMKVLLESIPVGENSIELRQWNIFLAFTVIR